VPNAVAQSSSLRPKTKQRLLEAAAELIAEVGWGAVSSRMVADRAGLNNALVHYHFDSMEDLLRQAAEGVVTEAFAAPTRAVWRDHIPLGMRRAVQWLAQVDVDATEVGVLAESLVQARRDPAVREHAAAELAALRAELTRAIETQGGHLADLGARGAAALLLAALDGLLLHRMVDRDLDLRPAARTVRALLEGEQHQGTRP
jgi:AcrR family transcriptional regulator